MNKLIRYNENNEVQVPCTFDVTLYGNVENYSDSISKCRVRIFYKGLNRNRTYISEDFANQLIQSLPYTPLKGIFNKDDVDFEGHGDANTDGRIYGIVMENPNFAWEQHLDTDGVTRTYACADVLLYTTLYTEAKIIPGSSQSMEINPFTYEGEWKIWPEDGMPYFEFTKGSLFGLQVLGMTTEPCFEGAAFYYNYIKDDLQPLIDYMKKIQNREVGQMDKNTNATPEVALQSQAEAPVIEEPITENTQTESINTEGVSEPVVDNSNNEEPTTENAEESLTKETTEETVTEEPTTESEKVVEETAEESADVVVEETSEEVTTDSSATVDENTTINNEVAELQSKLVSMQNEIDNLKDTLNSEKVRFEKEKADLINERDSLLAFKKEQEKIEKEAILDKYIMHLSDETIASLKTKIDTYSTEDFKKEVCTAAVENNPSIFSKNDEPEHLFYKNEDSIMKGLSGMERLLEKHKNGGSK